MQGENNGIYASLWDIPPGLRAHYTPWTAFRLRRALWRLAVVMQARTVIGAAFPVATLWLAVRMQKR